MSLFIAFKTENSVVIMSDAKFCIDYPGVGDIYYENFQMLASFPGEKIWMTCVGGVYASMAVFERIKEKKISNIDDIKKIDDIFFKKTHIDTLNKYNVPIEGKDQPGNCLSLLFGGIDSKDNPVLCSINSYDNYKKKWIVNDYEFVSNKIDFGQCDSMLSKYIGTLTDDIKNNKSLLKFPKHIIKKFDKNIKIIRNRYRGVGAMAFYVEIKKSEIIYKEFRKIRRFFDGIRYRFHYVIFIKILKVHKLRTIKKVKANAIK